jgi:signal transduction histidine kinase
VTAQERERRRLDSEIRAGVQRELEAIAGRLSEVEQLLERDPDAMAGRLELLATATQQALDRLRELARGIFPPILADKGLLPALQAQLRKVETPIALKVPAELQRRRYDPEIETALYFACIAAMRRATPATAISLAEDGTTLRFSIDGLTPDDEIQDSADRIAAVGGELLVRDGTVEGRVPVTC